MTQWYYADAGEQLGPVDAATVADLARQGRIAPGTLVWREGWSQWRPLAEAAVELGMASQDAPPPLPPAAAPQPLSGEAAASVVYAGFWRRWAALILDSLILAMPLLPIAVLAALPFGLLADSGNLAGVAAQGIYYLLYLLLAPLYYAGMESSPWQATLGKRAVGIKVCDSQGRRLRFAHALGRWVAALLSYLTFYVGFLMAAFTARKQALHDFVAGTLVVDQWAYSAYPERQRRGSLGCLVVGLLLLIPGLVVLGILAAIAIPAYQDYTGRARISAIVQSAGPAKQAIEAFVAQTDRCPRDWEELGLDPPAEVGLDLAEVGELADGSCAIQLRLGPVPGAAGVEGQHIWLARDEDGGWDCSADLEQTRYLPANCR